MRRSALLLLLAACGGAPAPEVPTAETTGALRFRLLSYNTWGLPIASLDLEERFRKLPKVLRELEPDVVVLQEVWVPRLRKELIAAMGEEFHATESPGSGLLTLSRYPIASEEFVRFPKHEDLPLTEWIAGKGILTAVLRTPRGEIRVLNTHLSIGRNTSRVRDAQAAFLLEQIKDARATPLILAADLNTPPVWGGKLTSRYTRFVDAGFVDVKPPARLEDGSWDDGPPTRVGYPRNNPIFPSTWRPDHVLYRSAGRLRHLRHEITLNTPETALSDHNLILVDFELR